MSSASCSIAFQKTGLMDGWLAGICSWFRPVLIGHVSGSSALLLHRGGRRRIFAEYRDKLLIEQLAWRFYRRRFKGGRDCSLPFRAAGLELDYAPLLLKAAADEIITLAGIRFLARKAGLPKPAYFGKLLWPPLRAAGALRPRAVAAAHAALAWLDELREAAVRLAVQAVRILLAAVLPRRDGSGINALWTGIMPIEIGRFGKRRSFYWPDRVSRSRLSNLYLLIHVPSPAVRKMLEEERVRAVSQFHILCFVPKPRLIALALKQAWTVLRLLLPVEGSRALGARICGMHFDALSWTEFARAVPLRLATATTSSWTSTRPLLAALRAAGVKTAVWCYSANSIPLQHGGGRAYFNGRTRTVHEAERIYVWNAHGRDWYRENLCEHPRNEVVVSGPTMCGDARLCIGPRIRPDNRLRIGVFDVSLPAGSLKELVGSPNLTPEYHEIFWSDIARLARDFPQTVLVIKTKRSVASRIHAFGEAFRRLVENEELLREGRIELIEDDADPYRAIADSDVAICMPFTSPALAAWHFGRVGIFHDSAGLVGPHRFGGMGKYFTRSYEELAARIREASQHGVLQTPEELTPFMGRTPMENPQEALLNDMADWALGGQQLKPASPRVTDPIAEEVPA